MYVSASLQHQFASNLPVAAELRALPRHCSGTAPLLASIGNNTGLSPSSSLGVMLFSQAS